MHAPLSSITPHTIDPTHSIKPPPKNAKKKKTKTKKNKKTPSYLDEDAVLDLAEAEELQDLLHLGRHAVDTADAHHERHLRECTYVRTWLFVLGEVSVVIGLNTARAVQPSQARRTVCILVGRSIADRPSTHATTAIKTPITHLHPSMNPNIKTYLGLGGHVEGAGRLGLPPQPDLVVLQLCVIFWCA
jgi:hypothetical protein